MQQECNVAIKCSESITTAVPTKATRKPPESHTKATRKPPENHPNACSWTTLYINISRSWVRRIKFSIRRWLPLFLVSRCYSTGSMSGILFMYSACMENVEYCTCTAHAWKMSSTVHVKHMHGKCRVLYMCSACIENLEYCTFTAHAWKMSSAVHVQRMHGKCRVLYMYRAWMENVECYTCTAHACKMSSIVHLQRMHEKLMTLPQK